MDHKRFKISIIAFILVTFIAFISMLVEVKATSVALATVTGIQLITVAFIGGDSYRKSQISEYSENIPKKQTEE
jgi:hypothetical protein